MQAPEIIEDFLVLGASVYRINKIKASRKEVDPQHAIFGLPKL
jgi:hypothetical protein